MGKGISLKKFLKYFDSMTEIRVMEFPWTNTDKGICLFEGHVFDDEANKVLKNLYKEKSVLERNEDGDAVMISHRVNEHGVTIETAQINVIRKKK